MQADEIAEAVETKIRGKNHDFGLQTYCPTNGINNRKQK
jgi:hypothetical protein